MPRPIVPGSPLPWPLPPRARTGYGESEEDENHLPSVIRSPPRLALYLNDELAVTAPRAVQSSPVHPAPRPFPDIIPDCSGSVAEGNQGVLRETLPRVLSFGTRELAMERRESATHDLKLTGRYSERVEKALTFGERVQSTQLDHDGEKMHGEGVPQVVQFGENSVSCGIFERVARLYPALENHMALEKAQSHQSVNDGRSATMGHQELRAKQPVADSAINYERGTTQKTSETDDTFELTFSDSVHVPEELDDALTPSTTLRMTEGKAKPSLSTCEELSHPDGEPHEATPGADMECTVSAPPVFQHAGRPVHAPSDGEQYVYIRVRPSRNFGTQTSENLSPYMSLDDEGTISMATAHKNTFKRQDLEVESTGEYTIRAAEELAANMHAETMYDQPLPQARRSSLVNLLPVEAESQIADSPNPQQFISLDHHFIPYTPNTESYGQSFDGDSKQTREAHPAGARLDSLGLSEDEPEAEKRQRRPPVQVSPTHEDREKVAAKRSPSATPQRPTLERTWSLSRQSRERTQVARRPSTQGTEHMGSPARRASHLERTPSMMSNQSARPFRSIDSQVGETPHDAGTSAPGQRSGQAQSPRQYADRRRGRSTSPNRKRDSSVGPSSTHSSQEDNDGAGHHTTVLRRPLASRLESNRAPPQRNASGELETRHSAVTFSVGPDVSQRGTDTDILMAKQAGREMPEGILRRSVSLQEEEDHLRAQPRRKTWHEGAMLEGTRSSQASDDANRQDTPTRSKKRPSQVGIRDRLRSFDKRLSRGLSRGASTTPQRSQEASSKRMPLVWRLLSIREDKSAEKQQQQQQRRRSRRTEFSVAYPLDQTVDLVSQVARRDLRKVVYRARSGSKLRVENREDDDDSAFLAIALEFDAVNDKLTHVRVRRARHDKARTASDAVWAFYDELVTRLEHMAAEHRAAAARARVTAEP